LAATLDRRQLAAIGAANIFIRPRTDKPIIK
jgi:hypothetical protein